MAENGVVPFIRSLIPWGNGFGGISNGLPGKKWLQQRFSALDQKADGLREKVLSDLRTLQPVLAACGFTPHVTFEVSAPPSATVSLEKTGECIATEQEIANYYNNLGSAGDFILRYVEKANAREAELRRSGSGLTISVVELTIGVIPSARCLSRSNWPRRQARVQGLPIVAVGAGVRGAHRTSHLCAAHEMVRCEASRHG